MTLRRALAVSLLVAVGVGAAVTCRESTPPVIEPGPGDPPPRFELPLLENVESGVADAIRMAHDDALSHDDAASWTTYGEVLFIHEFHEDAEEVCTYAADLPGADPFTTNYVAGLAAATFSQERAVVHLRRALEALPIYPAAHVRLGKLLEDLDDAEGAEQAYNAALDLEPSSHALLGLSRIAAARGEDEEAVRLLERARKVNPDHSEVIVALSQAYRRVGNVEASREAARAVPQKHRESLIPDPFLSDLGRLEREYNAMLAQAHLSRDNGNPQGAIEILTTAIDVYPDAHEAYATRGDVYSDLGMHRDAYEDYMKAVELEPAHAAAKSRAGIALAYLGKRGDAEVLLRAAIDDEPTRISSRHNLAFFFAQADPAQAIEILDGILADAPNETESRLLRAGIHADAGRTAEAIEDVETVLRQVPSHEEARRFLEQLKRR